ncbi:MAG TPA: endolytic transglycosylase MltG [Holosporales bacterium]|nr:endolytic transglycosylase MltG [Holosporales bacterium]
MKKAFSLLAVLVFVLSLGFFYKIFVQDYEQEKNYPSSLTIIIPPKTSAKAIGNLLEKEGIISSQEIFYWSLRLRALGNQLRSGEYHFPERRSLKSVIEKLRRGDVVYHRLTLAEGLTSREIILLVQREEKLQGDVANTILEGSLLPETYTFFRGESRQNIVSQMKKSMEKTLSDLWERYQSKTSLKTKEEVLILASIVEKETALEKERPHIAAVFLNRLKKGMPLQTDPTVIYAFEVLEQKPFERTLTRDDLKVSSPYNTYLIQGLPPGPICHPGKASLEAVLNPLESDDLFFVADGTGGHVFSKTYKEHAQNHNQWRKIKKKKNMVTPK